MQTGSEGLRRELGLWTAIAIVIGTTIGSAIFIVPKTMILTLGSPALVFAAFIVGGLLSLFGTLTYAELSSMYPQSGAEYVYLREGFGPFWGFTYGWSQTWVGRSGSIATLATGMFLYLAHFFPMLEKIAVTIPLPIGPGFGPLDIRWGQLLGIAVIALLGWLNCLGVRLGGRVHLCLTIVKLTLIGSLILAGLLLGNGDWSHFRETGPVTEAGSLFQRFFGALVAALWAYEGWNTVTLLGSEVENPQRNLPRALIGGILGIIFIYLLATVAYFYVLTPVEVGQSDRVAAGMMRHVFGTPGASAVSLAAVLSILAALNGTLLGGSRIPFAMARDGLFFARAAHINPHYQTPNFAIGTLAACSALILLSGRYEELFTCVIFVSWFLYGMTGFSVILLRRKRPDIPRAYRVPGYPWLPILFTATAGVLLYATAIRSPRESLLGLVIIVLGIPFYLHWRRGIVRSVSAP
ncbi:MAG TPA: amino acid permease [Bryobacteraceae bacterium]|jgi:amino acid transporter